MALGDTAMEAEPTLYDAARCLQVEDLYEGAWRGHGLTLGQIYASSQVLAKTSEKQEAMVAT